MFDNGTKKIVEKHRMTFQLSVVCKNPNNLINSKSVKGIPAYIPVCIGKVLSEG